MITRDQALSLINEHVENKNIVKHMVALEALMGGVYDFLESKGKSQAELGGTRAEWMMAGLLHDGDYCEGVPMEKQGIVITDWAREAGFEIPENVAHAMAAHNWVNTGVKPQNLMDWAIFCGDSLTGLITACALVLPERKLSAVTVERVVKKFGQPSFASGTRRDDIAQCEKELDMPLSEFVEISLKSMQAIASELGL